MTKSSLLGMCLCVSMLGCISFARRPAHLHPVAEESLYLSNIRQLTSQDMGFVKAGEAYFSPDNKTIIFQATPMGKDDYQIYTMNLKTGKPQRVSTGKGACTCAYFHPHKNKIIFSSSHLDPNVDHPEKKDDSHGYKWSFNPHMDIFEADLDGSHLRRLTDTYGYDAEGSYSADGKYIVFTSQRDDDLEIYVMEESGSNPKRITHVSGYDGGPFFSPDGKNILYRGDHRDDGKMNLQLRMVSASGENDHAITDNPVFNWCPYWYPDGKSLIFTQVNHEAWSRGERPNYDLFMTTPPGDRYIRITYHPEFDGLPVFNKDGTKIMWTSKRGGLDESQLFIADFKKPESLQ